MSAIVGDVSRPRRNRRDVEGPRRFATHDPHVARRRIRSQGERVRRIDGSCRFSRALQPQLVNRLPRHVRNCDTEIHSYTSDFVLGAFSKLRKCVAYCWEIMLRVRRAASVRFLRGWRLRSRRSISLATGSTRGMYVLHSIAIPEWRCRR